MFMIVYVRGKCYTLVKANNTDLQKKNPVKIKGHGH